MSPEISKAARAFANWVNRETAEKAGIKYGRVSSAFHSKDGYCRIYSGFVMKASEDQKGLHVVIGEKLAGKKRTWYFGNYEGPAWEKMTPDEVRLYSHIEQEFLHKRNLVLPSQLRNLIGQTVDSYQGK
jgi:hypothetical protein